jgi:hypothetical protein
VVAKSFLATPFVQPVTANSALILIMVTSLQLKKRMASGTKKLSLTVNINAVSIAQNNYSAIG